MLIGTSTLATSPAATPLLIVIVTTCTPQGLNKGMPKYGAFLKRAYLLLMKYKELRKIVSVCPSIDIIPRYPN